MLDSQLLFLGLKRKIKNMEEFNKEKLLEAFGKSYVSEIRDIVFRQFIKTINNKMKSESDKKLFSVFQEITEEQNKKICDCVLSTLDSSLHHFLWMIEQSDDFDLIAKTEDGNISLKEISDGLCGELYSNEGWISKYSEYPNLLN